MSLNKLSKKKKKILWTNNTSDTIIMFIFPIWTALYDKIRIYTFINIRIQINSRT